MPKKGYRDIKEEVVVKRTGKSFYGWAGILDKLNVEKIGRKAASGYLAKRYHINSWWSHVIVIRYQYEKKIKNKK